MTTARDGIVLVLPTGANADNIVRKSVKGLYTGRGLTADEVADGIAMPRSTFYKRMAGHGKQQAFSGGEVAALASFFEVTTDYLYTGLAGAFWNPPFPDPIRTVGGVADSTITRRTCGRTSSVREIVRPARRHGNFTPARHPMAA